MADPYNGSFITSGNFNSSRQSSASEDPRFREQLQRYRGSPFHSAAKKIAGWKSIVLFSQLLSVIVTAATAIYWFVSQETNPKSVYAVDGYEPIVELQPPASGQDYTGANGTSWSDCFKIRPPSDKYGFLHVWWNEHRAGIDEVLSLT